MMELFVVVFILIHLLCCAVCLILKVAGILKCDTITVYLSVFLPLFGLVMICFQAAAYYRTEKEERAAELNKLKVDEIHRSLFVEENSEMEDIVPISEVRVVNEPTVRRAFVKDLLFDVNQSIQMDEDNEPDQVVPISEALRINSSSEKRSLLMDVLYSSPESYISQLSEAKLDKDTEVVHYAVTALVEIQKDYELKLQMTEEKRKKDPRDGTALREYQHILEQYITSGLLSVSARNSKLRELSKILKERIEQEQNHWTLYNKLASVYCLLEDPEQLTAVADEIIRMSPESENGYLFRIRSEILKGNRQGILAVIKELEDKEIHLTEEGKQVVGFWK